VQRFVNQTLRQVEALARRVVDLRQRVVVDDGLT
jgi:hypothetical protein